MFWIDPETENAHVIDGMIQKYLEEPIDAEFTQCGEKIAMVQCEVTSPKGPGGNSATDLGFEAIFKQDYARVQARVCIKSYDKRPPSRGTCKRVFPNT